MSKELVISSNRHETKVAVLEEDQLVEIYFQRANEYSLAGSIHKGRVTRVLPGMQSAFVDVGLERDAFLYVSDFFEENEDLDTDGGEREERPTPRGRDAARGPSSGAFSPAAAPPALERPPERTVEKPVDRAPERAPERASVAVAPPADPVERVAPVGETAEGGDQRDRRGRRSRRRRKGGSGFPDSKYATDLKTDDDGEPEADGGPELGFADASEPTPFVLPGESLAKYRGAVATPVTVQADAVINAQGDAPVAAEQHHFDQVQPDQEPVRNIEEVADFGATSPDLALAGVPSRDAEVGWTPVSEVPADPPDDPDPNDPEEAPIQEPEPEPPPVEEPDEPAPMTVAAPTLDEALPGATVDPDGDEDEPDALDDATGYGSTETTSNAGDAEAASGAGIASDDAEYRSDAAVTEALGQADGPSAVGEDRENGGLAPASEAGLAESENRSAEVREPSGRFPHRAGRRTRRRGRSGDRPSQGPEPSPAAEPMAVGEAEPVPAPAPEEPRTATAVSRPDKSPLPSITDLLKEGQEIIVQIAKEPLGQKGARITSHIALPGRYVVYMPTVEHLGVSRKISSDEERQRLKRILQTHRAGIPGGFITRTAGESATEDEIAADMQFLYNLWLDMRQKAEKRRAPLLLHHDLDIVQRILRDQLTDTFKTIWVDSEDTYESVLRFVQRFQPALVPRVKLYTRPTPIFDAFGVSNELEKALRPKVWLKSGGYIVINQTEALVAVDVNTGKYVGKSNRLEDTIVKTNTEAVREIVRQVRLRDLGGIIVIDFIDMDERKNRQKVMQALEEAMREDRAPYKILQFNDFGLVAITRKRVKQSLERTLCSPCPYCEGAGYVKSVQTVVAEILQEAAKIAKAVEGKDVLLRVHPEVAKTFKSNQNKYLEELEEVLGRPVLVKGDPALHHEKYDLA